MSGPGNVTVQRMVGQPFKVNTYVITKAGAANCVVIDPGGSDAALPAMLENQGLRLDLVVLTHEHFDHVTGLKSLLGWQKCEVICARDCASALADPRRNYPSIPCSESPSCPPAGPARIWAGETHWREAQFQFHPSPGHSAGGICIGIDNLLFTGDTLLPGLKRVAHLPGGDRRVLDESLRMIFQRFPAQTLVYPGHGEPFRLQEVMPAFFPGRKHAAV